MAGRKFSDVAQLRDLVLGEAGRAYKTRWGEEFHVTHAQTLCIEGWRSAWEEAREIERQAQRLFAAVGKALTNAIMFAEGCKVAPHPGLPLGGAAQVLRDCGPAFVRTLDRVDQRRAWAITVQETEPLSRYLWIRLRLEPLWYRNEDELRAASREELATLALLGGWWPPKASARASLLRGVTVRNVFAWEGDLMDRARKRILALVDRPL